MFNRYFLIIMSVLVRLTEGLSDSSMKLNHGGVSMGTNHHVRTFVGQAPSPLLLASSELSSVTRRHRSSVSLNSATPIQRQGSNARISRLSMSAVSISGGAADADVATVGNTLASLWASAGVVYILLKAIRRVIPIALEPFTSEAAVALTPVQWSAYVITCLGFAYAEGFKGFQLKFAPLVVRRSWTLQPEWKTLHHTLLGPLYAMGLFHATKKRKIVSWSVSLGVAGIVGIVKRLPYPWRNILDAGVVVGLTWGSVCIIAGYVRALWNGGKMELDVDPALP